MAEWEATARQYGLGWSDIDEHIGGETRAASELGADQDTIDTGFGFDPGAVMSRAVDLATQPGFDYKGDNPALRASYANALHEGSARGPLSFADAIAGAGLSETGPDGRPDALKKADEIAGALPSRRALIDASIAIDDDPKNYDIVRGNLIDHWWDTGQRPEDAAEQALHDPELRERLKQPRGLLAEFLMAGARGASNLFFGINQLANTALAQIAPETAAADAKTLKRVMNDFSKYLEPTRTDVGGWAANLVGEGAFMAAALVATGPTAAIAYGALHGADQAWSDTHDMGAAAAGAAIGATEMGLPFAVLHGALGQKMIRAAVSSTIRMGAVGGLSAVLDPIPNLVAGKGYRLTPEDFAGGVAGGAVLGLLGGTLAKAMEPRQRVLKADGTTETMKVSEIPARDEALHEEAAKEAAANPVSPTEAERTKALDEIKAAAPEGVDTEALFTREQQKQDLADSYRAQSWLRNFFANRAEKSALFERTDTNIRDPLGVKYLQQLGAEDALAPLAKYVDKYMPDHMAAVRSGDPDRIINSTIGTMKRIMDGKPGVSFEPNHELTPVLEEFRRINSLHRARIEEGARQGKMNPMRFVEDYARRYWKNPEYAETRTGFWGAQRTLPFWENGIRAGLRDKYDNPLHSALIDASSRAEFLAKHDIVDRVVKSKDAQWSAQAPQDGRLELVQGYERRVPGPEEIARRKRARITHEEEQLLSGLPEEWHEPFTLDYDPNMQSITEKLYAPRTVKRMLESLRPDMSLENSPALATLNRASNALQTAKMGVPLFHAFVEMKEGIGTNLGTFLRSALAGDPEGMRAITKAITPRLKLEPTAQLQEGKIYTDKFAELGKMDPTELAAAREANPVLDALIAGGIRPGSRQAIYRPGRAASIIQTGLRGWGREMQTEWGGSVADKLGAIPYEMGRLATTVSAPLFDYAIPHLKMSANIEQMQTWMRQNPDASKPEIYRMARKIIDNTDDRMGELNLETVYWKPFTKRVLSLTAISTGWVYGTMRYTAAAAGLRIRSAGAGASFEWNTPAMFNLAGVAATVIGTNMLYQYIKTGSLPGQTEDLGRFGGRTPWLDLVAPRTGGTTKGGAPSRVLLPGEEKEYYDWGKIGAESIAQLVAPHGGFGPMAETFLSDVTKYAEAKDRSWLRVAHSLATGVDPIGHEIASMPGGMFGYLLSELEPIQVSSLENLRAKSAISYPEAIFGFREQPDWIQDPWRFNMIQNNLANRRWRDELRRYRREQAYLQ